MLLRLDSNDRDALLRKMLLVELEEKVKRAMAGESFWGTWAVMRCAELRRLGDDAKPYLAWTREDDGVVKYEVHVLVNGWFVEKREHN